MATTTGSRPCAACKLTRRKCTPDCIFAPFFSSYDSPKQFDAIHKVFGVSNASKILAAVPLLRRAAAAATLVLEAQARVQDPVYGCAGHVFALQQQVENLEAELAQVRAQLAREVASRALQNLSRGLELDTSVESPCVDSRSSESVHMEILLDDFQEYDLEALLDLQPLDQL
ncbi:LOB domain-containing protein 16-like [Canna indica]|uniref:LOB domain-containing protein 16-like n=1 Tax=Canna indica TaxID=4628 RepID=A0AAQ3K3B6_9LILI|nr:LOB domain-containing protein 16-like [Canna indica]